MNAHCPPVMIYDTSLVTMAIPLSHHTGSICQYIDHRGRSYIEYNYKRQTIVIFGPIAVKAGRDAVIPGRASAYPLEQK